MAQAGWGRSATIRLRDGGRRDVHILLPRVAHSRRQSAAWRGGIGVRNSNATNKKTTGITPIFNINMLVWLSTLV